MMMMMMRVRTSMYMMCCCDDVCGFSAKKKKALTVTPLLYACDVCTTDCVARDQSVRKGGDQNGGERRGNSSYRLRLGFRLDGGFSPEMTWLGRGGC